MPVPTLVHPPIRVEAVLVLHMTLFTDSITAPGCGEYLMNLAE